MPLSASARSTASRLRRNGMSETDIQLYLVKKGFIRAADLEEKQKKPDPPCKAAIKSTIIHTSKPNDSAASDEGLDMTNPKALQDYCLKLILKGNTEQADLLLKYLDKTKSLVQERVEQKFTYLRPGFLNPQQILIINAVQSEMLVAVEGDRQTGKTTAIWFGVNEDCITRKTEWHYICSNGANAVSLHEKVYNDKNTSSLRALTSVHTAKMTTFMNGSFFKVHNTTVNDVKGCTGNLWIDEVDQVIKDNPEVIAAAVALIRSDSNLRIVFSMNKGSGAYVLLLDALKQFTDRVKFIPLEKQHSPQIEAAGNDALIDALMSATMGKSYADQQLRNIHNASGDQFDPVSIADAFNNYNTFLSYQMPDSVYRYLAIDPSGTGHPWGWFVIAANRDRSVLWEIESGEIQMGTMNASHEQWTPDRILQFLIHKFKEHGCVKAVIESNSGGNGIMLQFKNRGLPCICQNFGADTDVNARSAYLTIARELLDSRSLVFKNDTLRNELLIYNPKEAATAKEKGDVADAFLHAIWAAVDGVQYFKKKEKEQRGAVVAHVQ